MPTPPPLENPLTSDTFTELLENILSFLVVVGGVVVVLLIAIAGLRYTISGGRPTEITAAKQMLIYAVAGYGIILFSRALVSIMRSIIS